MEVKVRELEGRLLLGLAAAERGHSVVLAHKSAIHSLLREDKLRPGIYHDKSLTPGQTRIARCETLCRRGFSITSSDEEGGLLDEDYEGFAQERYSESTLRYASLVFSWGKHDYNSLVRIYPKFKDRFALTGNPRVDFWRRDMSAYYAEPKLDGVAQFVLIASNLGTALNMNRVWSLAKNVRAKTCCLDGEKMRQEFRTYRACAFELEMLPHFIQAIRSLAVAYPQVTFVVRPHPMEAEGAWQAMIGEISNVRVCRTGSISHWIRSALALIHNGCTSALEAAACGTPVITFRPNKSELERDIPNRMGREAYDCDGLVQILGEILDQWVPYDWDDQDKRSILLDRFTALDGPLAADRIVDRWEALSSPKLCQRNDWTRLRRALRLKKAKQFLTGWGPATPRGSRRDRLSTEHKFEDLTSEELGSIISNLQRALNRFHGVQLDRLNGRAVVLGQKGCVA